jgi:alanine dehydrogenase
LLQIRSYWERSLKVNQGLSHETVQKKMALDLDSYEQNYGTTFHQIGLHFWKNRMVEGKLVKGATGVKPSKVTVIGGTVGYNAVVSALGNDKSQSLIRVLKAILC